MMKYFYSIFILLLLSGINYQAYTQNDTISALPYFQSFETADSSWYFTGQPDTINSQSRWGIGSDAALTPDYYPSGKRALICETSIFAELHHAYSPVFNISNLSELRCSFEAFSRQGLGTGPFYFPFEYAIDSDSIWNPINLSNYLFTPWTKINLNLDSLLGGNYIQFRFGSLTLNISYVDNFYLGLQNQVQDLCLNRFVNPNKCLDTLSQAISVEIINKGQNPVSQIELNLRFYGDSVKSETSIVTINPGDTIIHTFSDSINQLSYADDDIEVWIDTISDINTFDNYLVYFDRPTNVTIDTLPYIKSNIDNQYPEWTYSGPGAFNFLTGYFNKQYESPCFDFSNIDYPVLSFKIDATQPFDNIGIITLSYSTDGGNTLNFVDTVIKLESFNGTTANENFVYHFYELGGKENVKFIFHKMNQTLLALSGVTPSNIAVSDYTKNIAPLSIINTNCFTYALSTFFVEIENRGLFDAQNFAVTLHVDTITISDTIPFLAAGDTLIHYVSIGQPMNTPSMKTVTVFTSWVDDMVQNDNTLIQDFHLPGIISQYPYNWTPDSLPEYWHPNQP
ncbi:MAG: hypothetical protein U9R19_18900, partial [Bacteroidota bacterium]|nr:hypothetical protein [Bacteroidota bacterium]